MSNGTPQGSNNWRRSGNGAPSGNHAPTPNGGQPGTGFQMPPIQRAGSNPSSPAPRQATPAAPARPTPAPARPTAAPTPPAPVIPAPAPPGSPTLLVVSGLPRRRPVMTGWYPSSVGRRALVFVSPPLRWFGYRASNGYRENLGFAITARTPAEYYQRIRSAVEILAAKGLNGDHFPEERYQVTGNNEYRQEGSPNVMLLADMLAASEELNHLWSSLRLDQQRVQMESLRQALRDETFVDISKWWSLQTLDTTKTVTALFFSPITFPLAILGAVLKNSAQNRPDSRR